MGPDRSRHGSDQDIVVAFEIDLEVEVAGGEALDGGLRKGGRDDGGPGDFFRGGEIFLHERGRKRKHVGDVVEAVAGIIDGEIGGGLERSGQEIAQGGVVFVPVKAAGALAEQGQREHE